MEIYEVINDDNTDSKTNEGIKRKLISSDYSICPVDLRPSPDLGFYFVFYLHVTLHKYERIVPKGHPPRMPPIRAFKC